MTEPDGDLRRKTLHGLVWQFLGVGGDRILGLVSYMVIARLITDQGDVALFFVVLGGIAVVESLTLFMGEQSTISSARGTERRYLDTVFTVRVVRSVVISGLLCALAPAFAWFFDRPEYSGRYWLTGLFLALAGNGLIDGLQSPARAAKLKTMEFRRVVLGDVAASLLGLASTWVFAAIWANVWALLLAHLARTALKTVFSYAVAPHMPRFVFDRDALRDLFQYSKGAAGTPFLLVMIFASPAIVLGRFLTDPAGLAKFEFAGKLARLPEDIFLRVLGPVAIPAYAHLRSDRTRLARAWLNAVRAFLLVGAPMTVSLAWCGTALPTIFFTERYAEVPGLFELQSIHGGLAGLTAVVGPLFWAVGIPGRDRRAQLYRSLVIYSLGIAAAIHYGVIGFACAMIAGITTALVLSLVSALRYLDVPFRQLAATGRDGIVLGSLLLAVLLAIDAVFAPTGWWRLVTSALVGGPLLGLTTLRILRQRRATAPPPAVPPATPAPEPEPAP